MANVQGTFYVAETQRRGTTPVSPPNAVDDPQFPVEPSNPITFLGLTDVQDTDYVGKNGFVPIVVNESELQLQPLPQFAENGLISGGIVQWTGVGYDFNISSAFYRIGGEAYSSDATQLTLSAPDATNDRIDVFAVDTNGDVVVIEGTPASTPVKPQINPQTQLELTSVIVTAASTEPTLTEEVIYNENTEWTGSSSGTGTVNFASATNPKQGSVSVETTAIENGFEVQFDNGSTIDISTYQTFGFDIDLKASMPQNQNIYFMFLDGSGNPATNFVLVNLDKSSTVYQFIGVALNTINFVTNDIRYVKFRFVRSGGSPTYSGYFLDIVKFEGGINPPVQFGSFLSLSDTPSSYSGQGGKTVAVKADESGLEFITGGGITGSGTTNEIAYFTGATAIASLSTATYPSLTELSYVKGVTSSIQTQLNGKPTTFLGLTDTPATYASQANKFPRVNGGETALVLDTVSPYDLDQEGATDGQVLAWSTANSRYEPVAPSGGGSKWSDVGSGNIYRNSSVSIGQNVDPTETLDILGTGRFRGINNLGSSATEVLVPSATGVISKRTLAEFVNDAGYVTLTGSQNITGLKTFTVNYPTIQLRSTALDQNTGILMRTNNGGGNFASFLAYGNGVGHGLGGNAGFGSSTSIVIYGNASNASGGSTTITFRPGGYSSSSDVAFFDNSGINFINGKDIILGTTTGTKIGSTTSQKLAFWNKTPIIQPTTAITGATLVGGGGTTITDTDTFGGYTLQQIAAALINTGILA